MGLGNIGLNKGIFFPFLVAFLLNICEHKKKTLIDNIFGEIICPIRFWWLEEIFEVG